MSAKILIVDDESSARLTLENLLFAEGYTLQFAQDGPEGLARAQTWQPDVILSDVMMPGMDGFEFCRRIRRDASLGQIPIILITAIADRQARLIGLQAGADEFVTKPIDSVELRTRLRTLTRLDRFRKLNDERLKLEDAHRELVQTHAALRASDERFRNFIEQSTDGFLLTDEQGHIVEWNQSLAHILGLTREQALGENLWDLQSQLTPPEKQSEASVEQLQRIGQSILQGAPSPLLGQIDDFEIQTPDGTRKFIQQNTFAIQTSDGHCIGSVLRDITGRKQLENQLEAESVRRRVLFEESPDGILVIDPQTAGFVEFNTTAHTQLGYSREEFARLHIFDVEVQETADETHQHIAEVIQHGRADFETLQRTKQGEVRNVHVTAQTVEILGQPVYYCTWRDVTEQRRAEAARRESDDRYHLLFQTMVQGVVFQDETGRIIQANPAAERILGLTLDQMQGRTSIDPFWHAIHEDGTAFAGETHPAMVALRTGQVVRDVVMGVFNPMLDAYCWININAVPRFINGSTQPYQVYTTFEDITARKTSEQALVASQKRLTSLLDSQTHFVIRIGLNGKYTYWNARFAEEFGWLHEPAGLADAAMLNAVCEYHRRRWQGVIDQCQAQPGQVFSAEVDKPARDGGVRTVLWEFICLTDEHNQPTEIQGMGIELTRRKQAEQRLRESEAKYRDLINGMNDSICVIDFDTRILDVNTAATRVLGYTREELLAMKIPDIDAALTVEQIEGLAGRMPTDKLQVFQTQHRTKDGRTVPVEVSSSLVSYSGRVVIMSIARDITERKQAEEKLRESEARFRSIFESSNAIMMLIEPVSGRIIEANAAAIRFYGYTHAQLAALTIDQINQLSPDQVAAEREQAKREQRNYFIFPHRLADGQIRTVEMRSHPITSNGQVLLFSMIYDITESVQSQQLLQQSQLRMEMALKGANAATWDWNVQTGETVFNERWAGIVGYTLQELEPISIQTWIDLCHPDDLKVSDELLQKHFAGETDYYECEARLKHKNGSWVWVIDRGRVMDWDAAGKPIRMFGTHLDITERKREARYTEARLRLADLSFQTSNMDTLMRAVLDEAEALTDSTIGFFHFVDDDQNTINLQAWSTNTLANLCTAEGQGQHYPVKSAGVWADGIRDGEPRIYNDYLLLPQRQGLPDGHAPVTRLISLPIKRNNRVVAAMGVGNKPHDYDDHDLTLVKRLAEEAFDMVLRKRAEQARHASEEKYRSLLESLDSVVAMIDPAGRFLYMNEVAAHSFGGSPDRFIGRTMTELFPEPVASRQLQTIQTVIQTNQPSLVTNESIVRGQPRWYRSSVQPIHDESGQAVYALLNTTDITPIMTVQAQLEELNRSLEDRVALRTQELAEANASLAAMVDRLQELDQLKTKFVSDVSHELRTPVTSLSLYIDLLEHGKPEKREQYVSKLQEQMARLHKLINDILDMSRLERDKDSTGRSPVDINSIAEHVSAMERGAAETQGLALTCEVTDNLPAVMARPDQLTRAITNLVANAIKYTPQGTVHVRTYPREGRVCVEVADTGLGIPADELSHLFQRFYRGRAVAQSSIPGTGLGLSIVKEIIESHGGTVEVQSTVGVGSVFTICLPGA